MGKILLFVSFLPLLACGQGDKTDFLRAVLQNLERIETSSFRVHKESYLPGDTIPSVREQFFKTFANPADTTLGVRFLIFDSKDTTLLLFGYDGTRKAYIEHSERAVKADDFSTLRLPFRPIAMPFFNRAENIIRYALTTSDRIETRFDDTGDDLCLRLTIDEERQVEFFGRAYHMPGQSSDPRSVYEIRFRKSDGLPYLIRREMEHETTVSTVSDVVIGTLPAPNWRLDDYFPAGYEIHNTAGRKRGPKPEFRILGREAPDWSLPGANHETVSLGDFDGKAVLINFTGIGCGPCRMAIPFLNGLHERFARDRFALVAIETWKRPLHSIRVYSEHNKLKYPLLEGNDAVVKAYLPSSAVPVFVLLDRHRIVRRIFEGYSRTMDREITQAIETILQDSE